MWETGDEVCNHHQMTTLLGWHKSRVLRQGSVTWPFAGRRKRRHQKQEHIRTRDDAGVPTSRWMNVSGFRDFFSWPQIHSAKERREQQQQQQRSAIEHSEQVNCFHLSLTVKILHVKSKDFPVHCFLIKN